MTKTIIMNFHLPNDNWLDFLKIKANFALVNQLISSTDCEVSMWYRLPKDWPAVAFFYVVAPA